MCSSSICGPTQIWDRLTWVLHALQLTKVTEPRGLLRLRSAIHMQEWWWYEHGDELASGKAAIPTDLARSMSARCLADLRLLAGLPATTD